MEMDMGYNLIAGEVYRTVTVILQSEMSGMNNEHLLK